MGSSSDIDTSVAALYDAWRKFRQGKRASRDILAFEYYLEQELATLSRELTDGSYMHSPYRQFIVHDSKQRCIAVAAVLDGQLSAAKALEQLMARDPREEAA